jgi:hypothetical protein
MTLASLLTLADSSAQSEKVLIWTLILTSAGSLLTGLFSLIKGQMDRVQARKDKEQAAAEAAELREQDRLDAKAKAELLLLEGSRRERRLAAMIDQNTEVSKQAFATANGHNEKIKVAVEAVAEVAKVMAETAPKQIQVPVDGGK